jgi:hypothetical protein
MLYFAARIAMKLPKGVVLFVDRQDREWVRAK